MKSSTLKIMWKAIVIVLLFWGCSSKEPQQRAVEKKKDTISVKEQLANANKLVAQNEETAIEKYISRRNWSVRKMSNGIRIWEYEEGKGKKVDYNDEITIKYRLEAINGHLIYDETVDFHVGTQEVQIGLDQALRELKIGSKAKIIIPSHLGYGLVGDGNRIPKMAVLIYDLNVLKLNN